VTELYPSRARDQGVEGSATIDCAVAGDGRLYDCNVIAENPPGHGFGAATLSLASKFRMRPTTQSGEPVAGRRVGIPIRWRLGL
jgi:protein TonB